MREQQAPEESNLGQVVGAGGQIAQPLTAEEQLAYLEQQLLRYGMPRSLEFTTEALRDYSGTVRRDSILAHSARHV